jgi:two-component system NtrC family sensor kinase
LIGWAVAANKTILANDVSRDPRYIFNSNNREVRSELCVPIAMGTKTIGVLNLQSTQLEAFDRYHVAALETLADQLAIAIENARLYDKINRHITELKSLNEIGRAMTSTLDLQETLKLITNHTTRLLDVAAASVALRDDEANELWFAAASGEGSEFMPGLRLPLGQGLAGWVATRGEPVIVPDVYADDRFFRDIDKSSGFTTRSILCVPLTTKGRIIGAIEVMNKNSGEFDKEDLVLLQSLATSAATAIENAQLYEKQARTINRLAETQHQLVQSAKLAAVGELAAGIAHEINNPLTTIIAVTSLLADTTVPSTPEERSEDLQMIHTESRRARDIVRSLLDFARAESPNRQLVDLNQLIEEAIFLVYTKSVSRKVTLAKTLPDLEKMFLDANQIKQVFVNLLNNAIQAMLDNPGRPAELTISTALQTTPQPGSNGTPPTNPSGEVSRPTVICQISDTGCGIQPEHMDKIFDPFFTTKEVGQGTGLGLSISYGIIKQHGGDITVTSHPGQGSTFTVKLPVYHSQPPDYT